MSVKAFDLKSVLSVSALNQLGVQGEICSVEVSGNEIFVGTTAGFIFAGLYSENPSPSAPAGVDVRVKRKCHRCLSSRKPIVAMESSSAISKLLVVSDGALFILSTVDLEVFADGSPVIKHVYAICVNQCAFTDNPFEVQVCLARRKSLEVCLVSDEGVRTLKEISVGSGRTLHGLSMAGDYVVAAFADSYVCYDWQRNQSVQLMSFAEDEIPRPFVQWVRQDEFLISAPGSLGVFVKALGVSERPPIMWLDGAVGAAYIKPYVVAADGKSLAVFSLSDQKRKQALSIYGTRGLRVFEGRLFLWSDSTVYNLPAISWRDQVQALIESGSVSAGLELAQDYGDVCSADDWNDFNRLAGFVLLKNNDLNAATALFKQCHLDPRLFLRLWPDVLPEFANKNAERLPEAFSTLDLLTEGDEERKSQLKRFVLDFALERIGTDRSPLPEVVIGAFKLMAELEDASSLISFVSKWHSELDKDRHGCLRWLKEQNQQRALALFQTCIGDHSAALPSWEILLKDRTGGVEEQNSVLSTLVEVLERFADETNVIWRYSRLIFGIDPSKGLALLLAVSETGGDRINPDEIVDFLEPYPEERIAYLEHLVIDRKLEKEKYHTQLAKDYHAEVMKLRKQKATEKVTDLRTKLQDLLMTSSCYRVHLLLSVFRDSGLAEEQAILHGKLEDHLEALKIFVHQARNHEGALKYCFKMSEKHPKSYRQRLFLLLLKVHLDSTIDYTLREELKPKTLELLRNHREEYLDAATEVLALLPKDWPVSVATSLFLYSSIRHCVHRNRMTQLEASLSKCHLLQNKYALYLLQKDPVVLKRDRFCCICKKPFSSAAFARYPNGVETHVECARNLNICPVSGQVFKISSSKIVEST